MTAPRKLRTASIAPKRPDEAPDVQAALRQAALAHKPKIYQLPAQIELSQIVSDYVIATQLEDAAESVDEVRRRLRLIEQAGSALWAGLLDGFARGADSAIEAEALLDEALAQAIFRSSPDPVSAREICNLVGELVSAAQIGQKALKDDDREGAEIQRGAGEAWTRLVVRLADFSEANGGRATASKGGVEFKPSNFVRFVFDVVSCLPPGYWRHPIPPRDNPKPILGTELQRAVAKAIAGRRDAAE